MKAALLQLRVDSAETPEMRWVRAEEHLSQLTDADLILLPELWGVGFANFAQYEAEAEPLHGRTVARLAAWARRLQAHILTGSFVERDNNGMYNTAVLLDDSGTVLGSYRKIHLFSYGAGERERLQPGKKSCVVQTAYGVAGIATCYDLRFPEQFRNMTEAGAALFLVTAAWPKARLADWRLFCQARALENQSFLLACNHCGAWGHAPGGGHSMIVAPDGTILAEAGEEETVLRAEIDLEEVTRFRQEFPALRDRVPIE